MKEKIIKPKLSDYGKEFLDYLNYVDDLEKYCRQLEKLLKQKEKGEVSK